MLRVLLFLTVLASALPAPGKDLRIIPWNSRIAEQKLALVHSAGTTEVGYLHPTARSKPVKVPAGATGLHLETTERLDDEGRPYRVPVVIPKAIKAPLLLLLPDKKPGAGFRVMVMDDATDEFRWGTFRIINATTELMAFRWEDQARPIPTGWEPVDISPQGRQRNMEVALYAKSRPRKPFYTAVWEHRPDMRQLVFLIPGHDRALGPIECKFVPEKRLAGEEAP